MLRRFDLPAPDEPARLTDRVTQKKDQRFLISEAVRRFVASVGRARLRRLLWDGARRHAEREPFD